MVAPCADSSPLTTSTSTATTSGCVPGTPARSSNARNVGRRSPQESGDRRERAPAQQPTGTHRHGQQQVRIHTALRPARRSRGRSARAIVTVTRAWRQSWRTTAMTDENKGAPISIRRSGTGPRRPVRYVIRREPATRAELLAAGWTESQIHEFAWPTAVHVYPVDRDTSEQLVKHHVRHSPTGFEFGQRRRHPRTAASDTLLTVGSCDRILPSTARTAGGGSRTGPTGAERGVGPAIALHGDAPPAAYSDRAVASTGQRASISRGSDTARTAARSCRTRDTSVGKSAVDRAKSEFSAGGRGRQGSVCARSSGYAASAAATTAVARRFTSTTKTRRRASGAGSEVPCTALKSSATPDASSCCALS
jgi:hypothetical protein